SAAVVLLYPWPAVHLLHHRSPAVNLLMAPAAQLSPFAVPIHAAEVVALNLRKKRKPVVWLSRYGNFAFIV
ncbi:hypothetical protein ANCDUO_21868, partial [Ancylostoma duodenale]